MKSSIETSISDLFTRGFDAHNAGRFQEAEALYIQVLKLAPMHGDAHNLLGCIAGAKGELERAVRHLKRAIEINATIPEYHCNLGETYRGLGRSHDAVACFQHALRMKPEMMESHNNLGIALQDLCRIDEALVHYRRAVELKPDYVEARWNQALCLLLAGRYREGFQEYEWRWKAKSLPAIRELYRDPSWRGEPLRQGLLMLHTEQGMGDSLQFARFVPMAAKFGRVMVEVEAPLAPLFRRLPGIEQVIIKGEPIPRFSRHCPLMSLPRALDIGLDNLPAEVPYLSAPPEAIERWSGRLGSRPGLRVGLTWRGRPEHRNDRHRSMKGVSFFGIQKEAPGAEWAPLRQALSIEMLDGLDDYGITAGALMALDLVITVDTSVAHLAGALGRPVWLLLPYSPDWRWLLDRSDSPWYPTMRIFRQRTGGDWTSLVATVREALRAAVAEGRPLP
jgi:Tfp pilus assembly protein PilF